MRSDGCCDRYLKSHVGYQQICFLMRVGHQVVFILLVVWFVVKDAKADAGQINQYGIINRNDEVSGKNGLILVNLYMESGVCNDDG